MKVIHVLRKPFPKGGSVAADVLDLGCGALNINAAKIGTEVRVNAPAGNKPDGISYHMSVRGMPEDAPPTVSEGRWPANLILEHLPNCQCVGTIAAWDCEAGCPVADLDEQSVAGGIHGAGTARDVVAGSEYNATSYDLGGLRPMGRFGDAGGASRFFKQVRGHKRES